MSELIDTSSKEIKTDFFSDKNIPTLQNYGQFRDSKSHLMSFRLGIRHKWSIDIDNENVLSEPSIQGEISSVPEGEITSVPKESKSVVYEDSESLINNIFKGRDFIMNESWDSNELIRSRIINSDNEYVSLDCIVDIDTMHFEQREFPKSFFSNFRTLEAGGLVMIKIKSNPGSLRVDVYPGDGIINPKLFDINDNIEKLRDKDIGINLRGEW